MVFNKIVCAQLVIHTQVRYRVRGFTKPRVLCYEGDTKEIKGFLLVEVTNLFEAQLLPAL